MKSDKRVGRGTRYRIAFSMALQGPLAPPMAKSLVYEEASNTLVQRAVLMLTT